MVPVGNAFSGLYTTIGRPQAETEIVRKPHTSHISEASLRGILPGSVPGTSQGQQQSTQRRTWESSESLTKRKRQLAGRISELRTAAGPLDDLVIVGTDLFADLIAPPTSEGSPRHQQQQQQHDGRRQQQLHDSNNDHMSGIAEGEEPPFGEDTGPENGDGNGVDASGEHDTDGFSSSRGLPLVQGPSIEMVCIIAVLQNNTSQTKTTKTSKYKQTQQTNKRN